MLLKNFYIILSSVTPEDHRWVTTVEIEKDHPIFKGHFPEFPVTPGAGMLQIIKELTETHLNQVLFMTSASHVKFLNFVNPYECPRLKFDITIHKSPKEIKVKNTTSFKDGTVVLKCNVNFAVG